MSYSCLAILVLVSYCSLIHPAGLKPPSSYSRFYVLGVTGYELGYYSSSSSFIEFNYSENLLCLALDNRFSSIFCY